MTVDQAVVAFPSAQALQSAVMTGQLDPETAKQAILRFLSGNGSNGNGAAKTEAAWVEVDTSNLPPEVALAYAVKKEADEAAKNARLAFEAAFTATVKPRPGKHLVFGYRWGKLSASWQDGEAKAATSGGKRVSFSDL